VQVARDGRHVACVLHIDDGECPTSIMMTRHRLHPAP
jgi:hypothetical protein